MAATQKPISSNRKQRGDWDCALPLWLLPLEERRQEKGTGNLALAWTVGAEISGQIAEWQRCSVFLCQ